MMVTPKDNDKNDNTKTKDLVTNKFYTILQINHPRKTTEKDQKYTHGFFVEQKGFGQRHTIVLVKQSIHS